MNVKRFSARTSRDALQQVRQAFGDEAVVLSTRPCAEGVEVLAMAPDGLQQIEKMVAQTQPAKPAAARPAAPRAAAERAAPARAEAAAEGGEVDRDVEQLAMSTLSFQDYVRERMLKRRQVALSSPEREAPVPQLHEEPAPAAAAPVRSSPAFAAPAPRASAPAPRASVPAARRSPPVLRDEIAAVESAFGHETTAALERSDLAAHKREQQMMNELRSMKGLIEERFGALAFMEKLQRSPRQAMLTQKLLDCGFSPALIRKLTEALPGDVADESAWAAGVLERNLWAAEHEPALEDVGGVYALIGSTGVGKTTSTAKIAAAFATKHGAGNLGLITLDAYRVAAHEQLRTYGRILGVPVHTAHDRASLEDLLELLSAKKMVLIDTAGMAQRDARTKELLEMVSHRAIQKLLVVNAAAQGETVEDVMISYRAAACRGIVVSKMDEAVKLGPVLDALIRHKLKVVGVANGQRVPEDWHRLSSQALVQRALRANPGPSWRLDASDVNLVFAGLQMGGAAAGRPAAQV